MLGDSLAVSPSREQGFPAVLQGRLFDRRLRWTVTNASDSGDTTSDGLARVTSVLADDVGVLVLALGANDGIRGVDLKTIDANLGAIIEAAQDRGIAVLLCGMETPPWRGLGYSIDFHRIFPALASRYGIPLVPFLLSGVVLNSNFVGDDGVHPNRDGAEQIANTVWPHLEPLIQTPHP